MYRHFPNLLTMLRLLLAGVFFLMLNLYRYPHENAWLLWAAGIVFGLAAGTDALDGYLARKWHVESLFGRIMDPVCDKVLVLGGFIYLAGPRFVIPLAVEQGAFFTQVTGVYPWMVAAMLARELLVTSIRGELEGQGVAFAARTSGKWKMILQSVCIPVILVVVWMDPQKQENEWMGMVRDILVYMTVGVTLWSGWPYVGAAAKAAKKEKESN